jgi:hypothetical protein
MLQGGMTVQYIVPFLRRGTYLVHTEDCHDDEL